MQTHITLSLMKRHIILLCVITLFSMPMLAQPSASEQYTYRYRSSSPLSIPANEYVLSHTFVSGEGTIVVTSPVLSDSTFCFSEQRGLESLYIPEGVTSIGDWAFYDCDALTSVTIPNSVTSIGDGAFYDCDALTSITIPNSVTSIGEGAFARCTSLSSFHSPYATPDKRCMVLDGRLVQLASYGIIIYHIPNSVKSIGDGAFYDCDELTSITIPNSVTSIGNGAFSYCKSLTSITIPNSVTSIGDYAFGGCSSLTSITIPNRLTSIGDGAFRRCSSLTSVTIPDSVTSIGDEAFYKCQALSTITISAITPPLLGDLGIYHSLIIRVPKESVERYKAAPGWERYSSYIVGY